MLARTARRTLARPRSALPRRAPLLSRARPLHARAVARDDAGANADGASALADKINLRFATPTNILYCEGEESEAASNKVDMVVVPSADGYTGFCPQHSRTVALLSPGVVSVHSKDDAGAESVERFFVSGGFAVMKPDSTLAVTAVEAVRVSDLDPEAVREGLARYSEEFEKNTDPKEKALSQIGVEVHTTMNWALEAAGVTQ